MVTTISQMWLRFWTSLEVAVVAPDAPVYYLFSHKEATALIVEAK